jgi:hypothetical protein
VLAAVVAVRQMVKPLERLLEAVALVQIAILRQLLEQ